MPVLISYCQYLNFMDTERQQIQLNLAALEKRIMDQFVLGKPYIMFDVPLVVFKRELTSTLRKKIIQVCVVHVQKKYRVHIHNFKKGRTATVHQSRSLIRLI